MQFTTQIAYRGLTLDLSYTTQLHDFTFSFYGIRWTGFLLTKKCIALQQKVNVE